MVGSIVSTTYASGMDGATSGLPHGAAEAASDSVGGPHEVAAEMGGGAAAKLVALADQSFVDAMTTAAGLAAGALAGALLAAALLPARARGEAPPAQAEVPETGRRLTSDRSAPNPKRPRPQRPGPMRLRRAAWLAPRQS